ncbi:transcriptional regulator [Macrococcus hajekii]|uniref:Transcriptional regulator n=1 Tax=Macrococcus hajekii TaxID=198482 RepID=A0A4V6PPN1_9STAP|nr:helix-turn-helix domain-containing protein [Macrococcus hajekii]TDM01122.1 transcriptional regulator [Macrococcus hajekii]GGB12275.1 HxlR family transcriptional regulator [Macrococcus hajekii]
MEICPYLEETFKILGRSWNGLLINYLSRCDNHSAHFSDIKKDLKSITPRALSLKLSELADWGLIEKKVTATTPLSIEYVLTPKGYALSQAMSPIEKWAQENLELKR